MRSSKISISFAWMAVLVLLTTYLGASTITAGYIDVPYSGYPGTFSLSGSGFTVDGRFYPDGGVWEALYCRGCAPGTPVGVYGTQLGNDFSGGSATIWGHFFPSVNWGDFYAAGPSEFLLNGPDIVLGSGAGTYRGTFSFGGLLCGTDPQVFEIPNPCIVNLGMNGTGIVSIDVSEVNGLLMVDRVTYAFTTPEPSTLALLGSAVLGFGAAFRARFLNS